MGKRKKGRVSGKRKSKKDHLESRGREIGHGRAAIRERTGEKTAWEIGVRKSDLKPPSISTPQW